MKFVTFVDKAWITWSWISSAPLLICTMFRFFTQESFLKEKPKKYFTDDIFRLLIFPGLIYYTSDTLIVLMKYKNFSWCDFGYIFHHAVSLVGAKTTLTLDHYPWFMMAPFTFHTLLMIFPEIQWLNYFYLLFIIICFRGLLQEPWKHISEYIWEFQVSMFLVCGPLVVLWLNSCSNEIDYS